MNWKSALPYSEMHSQTMVNVKLNGQNILIAQVDGEFFALQNDCPHLGCLLHKGTLRGYEITCPCHDWTFDLRTGAFTAAPEISIPTFPVKIENGKIYINLGGDYS